MPTPVTTTKQCLTPEAARALDEAVAVARRRRHSQTTSLHAVSAFLALPNSPLREACVRARNAAFYPRVQLKALDFCLSVSLDRLPTSQHEVGISEPPVSNSLMAAIKRSQANQRRQPDSYSIMKQQQQGQEQGIAGIRVELQHLIVSILDDPIVSRVFNEAGFSSFEIKLAIVRPLQSFFRCPRLRGPQSFAMGNVNGYPGSGNRPFRFPFPGFFGNVNADGNHRRIGEVMVRKQGRNPLLVGICAYNALRGFLEVLEKKRENVLPLEVSGVNVVSMEKDILKFVNENQGEDAINLRFREVGMMVEHCLGPGLVVSFGELKAIVGGEDGLLGDAVNTVVKKLSNLLEVHGGRVWLIGSATTYEMYLKFLNRFPSIEKDWDLQLLPITSLENHMGESYLKSSFMGSFVPFGGFFSSASDFQGQLISSCQYLTRCNSCNEKFEREVAAISKSHCDASCTSWLEMDELNPCNRLGVQKANDSNGILLTTTMADLQSKWDNICQHLHHRQPSKTNVYHALSQVPVSSSFHLCAEKSSKMHYPGSNITNFSCSGSDGKDSNSCVSLEFQKHLETPSKSEHTSPGVSVTTDLGLAVFTSPLFKEQKKANIIEKCTSNDFKSVFESLMLRIGRQEDAVRIISQTIVRSRMTNLMHPGSSLRRNISLNLTGSDIFSQKKTALALAEILYGSKNNFLPLDLRSADMFTHQFSHRALDDSIEFRGKNVIDYIAGELHKRPFSVVFLEHINHADPAAQKSLLQAIRTGKLSDSYGKEVSVNDTVFVLSSISSNVNSSSTFPEERLASAKGWPIQIIVQESKDFSSSQNSVFVSEPTLLNKRKLHRSYNQVKRAHKGSDLTLDLNLPAEDDNVKSWSEKLLEHVDETVRFEPFDYDKVAENALKRIEDRFRHVIGLHCLLMIELRVMDQILAALCLSEKENELEEWVDHVLSEGFAEAQKRYVLVPQSVIKIASCENLFLGKEAPDPCLPSKIILN